MAYMGRLAVYTPHVKGLYEGNCPPEISLDSSYVIQAARGFEDTRVGLSSQL